MISDITRGKFLVFILITLLISVAFSFGKHFENFFPLDEGKELEYNYIRLKGNEKLEKAKIKVSNLAIKTINNIKVIPRKYEKLNDKGEKHIYTVFFKNDNEGILFLAIQKENESQPNFLPHPFYYMKNPINVGTIWGGGETPRGVIEGIRETVNVPAGTFNGCVKVKITYPQSMPIQEALFWFAPKVGIVKTSYLYKNSMQEQFELIALVN